LERKNRFETRHKRLGTLKACLVMREYSEVALDRLNV
jgi:hypothetical protein